MEVPDFNDFFRSVFPDLVRYAQRQVNSAEAEDLAQLTLEVIWNKNVQSPRYDLEHKKLKNLAYRVLEGLLRNRWRAEVAYRQAIDRVGKLPSERTKDLIELVVFDEWPEWTRSLSLTDRQVLELVIDGYKVAEIAIILDCTPAAVSMRLQRARKNAKALWADREVNRDSSH
ncbi:hypothetical protein BHE97_07800 [Aeromicrobium sp. PE09-221]|uniref:RNA polymerase sigma factor n=1 Tax=Aeromicrobium sp. PE09-221 TaxID=1898043 RepID=UPI000B3E41FB|nr:sigma-70 family RNA polymerase sigma factor [Aeromicrobium sp. PE09-221]OUZ10251.1 hypothetical protein BHE97_07800 [Aeromicrobium sp. PE09-221]